MLTKDVHTEVFEDPTIEGNWYVKTVVSTFVGPSKTKEEAVKEDREYWKWQIAMDAN